ncbi:MAG: zf-TFIIB domain-containing protein [Myxococcota bacterium]
MTKARCPKCEDQPLYEHSSRRILQCPACRGLWLSNEEAQRASVDPKRALEVEANARTTSASSTTSADSRTGLCPYGHGIMRRAKVHLSEPFFIERCVHCGGLWFDQGELAQLASSPLMEHLFDLWSTRWQLKQGQKRAKQSREDKLRARLDEAQQQALFEATTLLAQHPAPSRALGLLEHADLGTANHAKLREKLGEPLFERWHALLSDLRDHPAGPEAAQILLEETTRKPEELALLQVYRTLLAGASKALTAELKAALHEAARPPRLSELQ